MKNADCMVERIPPAVGAFTRGWRVLATRASRATWPTRLRPRNQGLAFGEAQYCLRRAFGLTASAAPTDSPQDCLLDGASAQGALAFYAKAPIGSHAGSMVAGSSRALRYSSGSSAFGTATSYTYSVNQSSLMVK